MVLVYLFDTINIIFVYISRDIVLMFVIQTRKLYIVIYKALLSLLKHIFQAFNCIVLGLDCLHRIIWLITQPITLNESYRQTMISSINMVEENGSFSEGHPSSLLANLKLQSNLGSEWLREDAHLLNSYLVIQSFRKLDLAPNTWQSKHFREEGDYDYHCYIQGCWQCPAEYCKEEGLELSGKIITYPCKIQLRALAINITLRVKLSFHSSLYIIPRVSNEITCATPVIKILKDANLRGIFLVFGSIDPQTHKFTFIKQNQIPEQAGVFEETRELEIGVIDNGDDKIFVNVNNYGKVQTIKCASFCCPGFAPMLKESQVFFAGHGDNTLVKSISIQYRERNSQKPKIKRTPECTCSIV